MNEESREAASGQSSSDKPATLKDHVASRSLWRRIFFMLAVAVVWWVARFVTGAVVVIQTFWVLLTGERNESLRKLGNQLALFSQQVVRYLSFNSEDRPYPFDLDWPEDMPEKLSEESQ